MLVGCVLGWIGWSLEFGIAGWVAVVIGAAGSLFMLRCGEVETNERHKGAWKTGEDGRPQYKGCVIQ